MDSVTRLQLQNCSKESSFNSHLLKLFLQFNLQKSKGPCTQSVKFSYAFFSYSSFPIKMLAMDAKTQKIEPDLNCFYDGRNFRRQCVNVIAQREVVFIF